MKHVAARLSFLFLLLFTTIVAQGQDARPQNVVVDKGPHHRVFQRVERRSLPNGRIVEQVKGYTELANGLNYWSPKDGQWLESQEIFEPFQDGVVARQGPYQVILSPNLVSPTAVDLLSADGKRFQSTVLGLGLYDSATGVSELIAETKSSVGRLVAPSQVVYPDAFDGVQADVRYTYQKSGFEQDVILRGGFTLPPNFNKATTRLEVWTEFRTAPKPERSAGVRGGMEHESIQFGELRVGAGKAFSIDPEADATAVPVAAQWMEIQGRTFLVESVRFDSVESEITRLGGVRQAAVRKPAGAMVVQAGQRARPFPTAKVAKPRPLGERIEMASVTPPGRGFVVDYNLQSTYGSLLIEGNSTVYISGTVIATNVIIEGGAVLKFNTNAVLELASTSGSANIDIQSDPYLPVVFTAKDDQSIGEVVGTGPLTGYYANPALRLHNSTYVFKNLRFSYAREAINLDAGSVTLRHGQFTYCQKAFGLPGPDGIAENSLFYSVSNVVYGQGYRFHGRNVTVHQCNSFAGDTLANGTVTLTNSLLVHLTNWGASTFTTNLVVKTTTSPFQVVGAASHYLATSAYRNLGTTNVPADLLKDLRKTTTYPPLLLDSTTWYTANLNLVPQAQRDTDGIDLGYHYWPIDYVAGGVVFTNAILTASNGVVIATRAVNTYGIALIGGASFLSGGRPEAPNRIVRYNTVLEQSTTNWGVPGLQIITDWVAPVAPPHIAARFTHWTSMAGGEEHLYPNVADDGTHHFASCEFHNADVWTASPTLAFTNCLFNRAGIAMADDYGTMNHVFRNNTFHGGAHYYFRHNGGTWTVQNNLYDGVTNLLQEATITHGYNGYTTNGVRLTNSAATDVVLTVTNITYNVGTFGRFYLPTNLTSHNSLFNTGSVSAASLQLYFFTSTTNQVKETNSIVDLGYHSVAADSARLPTDFDGDGLPDYLEDANGDGNPDTNETNWSIYNSLFGIGSGPGLVVFTPLKP